MKYRFFIALSFVMTLLVSCQEKKQRSENTLKEKEKAISLDWLLGQWMHQMEEGNLVEDWEKINDSTYFGKSYLMAENDTLFSETLMIQLRHDSIIYSSQNQQTMPLKSKDFFGHYAKSDFFEVTNELQAFPKSIKYQSLNDTLLMIEIGGIIDGEEEIQPYQMVRRRKNM